MVQTISGKMGDAINPYPHYPPPLFAGSGKTRGVKLRVDRFYYKKHCKIFRPLRGRKNKRGVKLKGGVKLRDMG